MELPPEINDLVQQHLGRAALDIQAEAGRGAWIATADTDGEQARYVLLADLETLFGGGSRDEFDQLIREVEQFDPTRQVVILFNVERDLQMIATVDIE